MGRILTGPAGEGARSGVVTGTEGNVVYCDFRAAPGAPTRAAARLEEMLAGIRDAIEDINGATADSLTLTTDAAALEKSAERLLLKALDSVDNIAFQSSILLAGARECRDTEEGAEFIAQSLWRFVTAGVVVSKRLRNLAGERRSWIGAEARVLQEIVADAAELESTASACISLMRAETPDSGQPG